MTSWVLGYFLGFFIVWIIILISVYSRRDIFFISLKEMFWVINYTFIFECTMTNISLKIGGNFLWWADMLNNNKNFSCPDCIFGIPRPDFLFRSNTHAIYFVLFKFLGCTSCEKNLPTLFTCLVNFGNSPTKTPLLVIHPHPVKMKVAIGYTHTF